ncbi:MAG: GspE/PulE family protein [bacterium]
MFKEYDYANKPVVEIVDEILLDAIALRASDIHFDPTPEALNVRVRVDGELRKYATVPEVVKKNLITRIKIISGMNITEMRLPQDGAIKNLGKKASLDLRVSSLPIAFGEKIVIRILDYEMSSSGLDSLGFSPNNFQKIKKLISLPNGIILVSGATGTGKSTTVYSMLQELNTESRNIITVEDPIEMKVDGINQVQVMSEIGLTFASTLRSILRQDPDIIMIGEMRDDETARIAVRASITGHLVLSTIHTNSALNTIERLLDMNVERYLLGTAISGIIAQRLTKKLCPHCRQPRALTEQEKKLFKIVTNYDMNEIYIPCGCDQCVNGYKGRVSIHEVLVIDQDIRDDLAKGADKSNLRDTVYNSPEMTTLLQDGLEKVAAGLTSLDEIYRIIDVVDDLKDESTELKDAFLGNPIVEDTLFEEDTLEVTQVATPTDTTVQSIETIDTIDSMTDTLEVSPLPDQMVAPVAEVMPTDVETL